MLGSGGIRRSLYKVLPRKVYREFTMEFIVVGRNDDYEQGWTERLNAVLAFNRQLFEGSSVEFRAAFVEWNSPVDRPLLAFDLRDQFPFLRAIIVDPGIHEELSKAVSLQIMLNFAINSAIRSSSADFILVSGGDVFLGSDIRSWLVERGLCSRCLYRAIRVDVRRGWVSGQASSRDLEDVSNIVRINETSVPPYTEACGDFILIDRQSMFRITGFDESIRDARMHLDSRCCLNAMALGFDCRLIGHVYHVDHKSSWVNAGKTLHADYDSSRGIPYRNPSNWGLAGRTWKPEGERVTGVA